MVDCCGDPSAGFGQVSDSSDAGAGVVEGDLGAVVADLGDDHPVAQPGRARPHARAHGDRPPQANASPAGIAPVGWISASTPIGSAPCPTAVRSTLASTAAVSAPLRVLLPPQCLRLGDHAAQRLLGLPVGRLHPETGEKVSR